ncbi:MAG TPA: efflux RND transporter permease subunit [Planctomycetaceae bacterium]|nr:efflux RND transporter permease subunit [Planctomycetaceae bacterium]
MFSRFFIERPVFATVLSLAVLLIGGVAAMQLPIAQYPDVTPPTVSVSAIYPGANAKVVAETVATPIEQEVNGVERMLYMSSKCTNDGQMTLDVTFELGTNLDMAQVLIQNRVSIADAKLPEEVKRQGVTVKKKSPNILLCVNLISPDDSRDQLYLSNFATINVKDALARVKGVGDVTFLGARDYSMRVWLDPEKLASRDLTAGDVLKALREQNVQVAAGRLGQPPTAGRVDFQLTINTLGRLLEPEQFADVIIKTGETGQIVRVRDIGRVELGAKNYDVSSLLDGKPSVTLAVFQMPGSNALGTADNIRRVMEEIKKNQFKSGVDYEIVYDTTVFIDESVHEVYKTLFEAFVLVFIVVLVFLQDWRATLLPMIDVPVSLVGTFAVMALLGFSINNLTLFGMVLAIGIVVDDAIVVIENVERWLAQGLPAKEATAKAMDEITPAVIAITLVLCSVFLPAALMAGISGQFYKQFALTIAASMVISAMNAMTMTPSRAVQIFGATDHSHAEGHSHEHKKEALPDWGIAILAGAVALWLFDPMLAERFGHAGEHGVVATPMLWGARAGLFLVTAVVAWLMRNLIQRLLQAFFAAFNQTFDVLSNIYGAMVGWCVRLTPVMLLVYVGLLGLTVLAFQRVPTGFIPEQDKGYLVVNAQLPDGASLERTEAVVAEMLAIVKETDGVAHSLAIPGYSLLTSVNIPNMAGMFVILEDFEHRKTDRELSARAIAQKLRQQFQGIHQAQIAVFGAPPVDGLGSTGGAKVQIEDRSDTGAAVLEEAVTNLGEKIQATPGVAAAFSTFRASQPQLFVEIDREKVKAQQVALSDVFDTLQIYLGSGYANDFTFQNRNWQVNLQADAQYRAQIEDIGKLKVRTQTGVMVPLATLIAVSEVSGPAVVNHYNMYPSAELNIATLPGTSSGQIIATTERLAESEIPSSFSKEWTELTLQQLIAERDVLTKLVFPLGVIFVFLVLAAKYESWSLPTAILLIVPLCLLAAMSAVWVLHMDNNIFTQIGLLVLVGLAAKNAILIVEFAKQLEEQGKPRFDAVVDACRLRLRPILMTSFAFALGVLPLVRAIGAGAEMRVALGVAVFWGMLGVTAFGLFFTPVFYVTIMWLGDRGKAKG